jgi:hypothetical protein
MTAPRVGVVETPLLIGELVLDELVFNAVERKGTGGVKPERAKIAGENFHRRGAAVFDRLYEFGACGEGKVVAAPQAEALGIGEIVDSGRARRRDVDHARVSQGVLQAEACASLLRMRDVTSFARRRARRTSPPSDG